MAGDREQPKVEPDNQLVQFYEAIKPKWPPEGHLAAQLGICSLDIQKHVQTADCRDWSPMQPPRFFCLCGAEWTVSKKELDAGIDHIEDHYRYALKTKTRVD